MIGGEGPPLLLVHGWRETWYAWRIVMPALAEEFEVIAVDQRGIGLSDKPDRVERLVVSEAFLPGIGAGLPLFVPPILNARLWHLMFNQLPAEVNEALVRGREEIFLGAEFATSAGTTKLPDEAVEYYIELLAADPEALRGSFEFYRAFSTSAKQNEERKDRRLTIPVLAMGGEESGGENAANALKLVADDVKAVVLPGSGPLGRRAGSRCTAGGAERVPGPLPGREPPQLRLRRQSPETRGRRPRFVGGSTERGGAIGIRDPRRHAPAARGAGSFGARE